MKNIINAVLTFGLLLMTGFIWAQSVYVTTTTQRMSKGDHFSYTVDVPANLSDKEIRKCWQDFVKDHFDEKPKENDANEWMADDAEMEQISRNTVDIYAKIKSDGNGKVITAWFDLGGAFLNPADHKNESEQAKSIMKDFHVFVYNQMNMDKLDDEKDALKDYQKELDKLRDDEKDLKDDIKDCEEDIKEARAEIENNRKKQVELQQKIDEQKRDVEKVKDKIK